MNFFCYFQCFVSLFFFTEKIYATQNSRPLYFDADHSFFQQQDQIYYLKGQVVALSQKTMLTADELTIDKNKKQMIAKGQIFFLDQDTVFSGDELLYNWENKTFRLLNGWIISDDPKRSKTNWQNILGFTQEDSSTEDGLSHINENQPSDDVKALFEGRKKFLAENSSPASKKKAFDQYFRLTGERIERIDQEQYEADQAFLTGCQCEDDESAPWGFQAYRVHADDEGYADLQHAWLKIKGIPVFYLPVFRLPLKKKRQSGFLVPSISLDLKGTRGSRISTPFFGVISENQDITLDSIYMQKQKWQLGLQYRIQTTTASSWEANFTRSMDKRHKILWSGSHFLTPRLSLVSEGLRLSDPLYIQDFETSRYNDQTGFFEQTTLLTAESGWQIHWDQPSFYLGIKGRHGQYLREVHSNKTIQEPLVFKYQSRVFSLFSKTSFPIYLSFDYQGRLLSTDKNLEKSNISDRYIYRLSDGSWQQARMQWIIPLAQNTPIDIHAFSDWTARSIYTQWLNYGEKEDDQIPSASTNMYSIKEGVQFNMPLTGQMTLAPKKILEHKMEWSILLTAQPFVEFDNPYYGHFSEQKNFDETSTFIPSTFYENDSRNPIYSDIMENKEAQFISQKVTFLTQHSWNLKSNINDKTNPFLTFQGSIFYDHEKQKKRWNTKENTFKLIKPWSTVDTLTKFFIFKHTLASDSHYDFYTKKNLFWNFTYTSKPFWGVRGIFSYKKENIPSYDAKLNKLSFLEKKQKEWSLTGSFLSYFNLLLTYGTLTQKKVGDLTTKSKTQKFLPNNMGRAHFGYRSPTNCWGLSAEWFKPYEEKKWENGTFLVNLSIESFGMKQNHNVYSQKPSV